MTEVPMSPAVDATAPANPPRRSLLARMIGLVTSPRAVFEELRERPSWVAPALVLSALSLIVGLVIYDDVLYPSIVEKMESRSASPEQTEQALAMMGSPMVKVFSCVAAGVFTFGFVVLCGLVLYGVCSFLLGGRATVRQALSVAAHAFLVVIPRSLVLLPLMFARRDPTLSIGPGVLMPPSEATDFFGRFVANLMSGTLDLFYLWALGLAIVGMSVMARLSTRGVAVAVTVAYFVLGILFSLFGALQG